MVQPGRRIFYWDITCTRAMNTLSRVDYQQRGRSPARFTLSYTTPCVAMAAWMQSVDAKDCIGWEEGDDARRL